MTGYKYHISQHCRERYTERINGGVNIDSNILLTVLNKLLEGKDITNKVFDEAPRYILFLYEKYSDCKLTIIQSGEVIFICKKRPGTTNLYDVLTCYNSYKHLDQFKNTAMSRENIYIKIKQLKTQLKNK